MITLDFETKSYADLAKVGAWVYSEHPTTDVICTCWGIDNEEIQEWWPGKNSNNDMPHDLHVALVTNHVVEAHNVSFEYSIWLNIMAKRYGWIVPAEDQWRDTMAVACYYALPAKLDHLARALHFEGKDPAGSRLITKYSKLYLKTAKEVIPDEDFFKFVDYCKQDVRIEQSISDYLGDLPKRELPLFLLDQIVNRRGLFLDLAGIEAATAIVEQREAELTSAFKSVTGGFGPAQHAKVLQWFHEQGLKLDNLQAEYLNDLLDEGDLPQGKLRTAIELRLKINKASTKKLDAMARQRGSDGRARFQTRYHGAVTGRNTGTGLQPLNLNRGFDESRKITPEMLVRDIHYRDPTYLDMLYGDAMDAVSRASRHWIMAEPGNKLMSGDFVSIEAVILACLAGEAWKIEAFKNRALIYELMADKIYNLPPGTVTKKTHPTERQDGKIGELAFGYQGALGAWLGFDNSGRHTDERIIEICKAWRKEHPMIVDFWYGLEEAAIEAVTYPGRETGYRQIGFEMVDEWLSMIGPNGKRIWYYKPRIKLAKPQWHNTATKIECFEGTCTCQDRPQLTYMAQKFGNFIPVSTYGGKLTENATQFVSREVLMPAMLKAEVAGYHVILSVYDEIVCEVPKTFGSTAEFENIMRSSPGPWAKDWPINVDAWEGERYKK